MIKKLISFVFFLLLWNISFSQDYQYDFNKNCEKAYEKLLFLQLDSAAFYIEKEEKAKPHNLIPALLSNYQDFLKIVLEEDEKLFEELSDEKKRRLSLWKKGPKESPWYLSGQAQIKLQWAFSRVLFDEYFTAATEINSAYHLLEENKKEHPEFLADNMGIGILHAMIGVVPDQYQWAMEMLGLYGTIDQGLAEIKKQIESKPNHVFSQEALFYYTFARLNLQTDPTRITELLNYYSTEPYNSFAQKSPLLHFSEAVVLLKTDNDKAITHLLNPPRALETRFYYPIFLLGQAYLYQLNPKSDSVLIEYIERYPGKNYKKTAYQRLAWSRFIQGDTLAYYTSMRSLLNEGASLLDSDKSAQKEAKAAQDNELPQLNLLRCRLQFDGHYYEGALDELDKVELSELNIEQLLEYHYRKARVFHEMGNYPEAFKAYTMALEEGKYSERYYAANAALKMGEMAEELEEFKKAEDYYQRCLELDFSEYRRGIRAKAKAGIQRVDNK